MSINKRGDKYQVFVDIGFNPITGKRQRKTKLCESEDEAKIVEADFIKKLRRGIRLDSGDLTVEELLYKYLDSQKNKLKPRTYQSYKMIIEKHLIPILGAIELQKLNPEHIDWYQDYKLEQGNIRTEKGLSNRTVQYHHRVLSRALKQAVRWRYIEGNPCNFVDAPSVKPMRDNIRPITANEIKLLFDEMEGNLIYDISLVGLLTGMRLGEITGLKESYVELKNRILHIEKSLQYIQQTGKFEFQDTKSEKRDFKIEETLLFLFKRRINKIKKMKEYYGKKYNDEGYLFCYKDGKQFKNYNISGQFNYRRDKLGLSKEIHFHCLRHTFATMFLEKTNDMKTLQYLLGHSTYNMTANIYSHVTDKMKKKSGEVSRAIDELLFAK